MSELRFLYETMTDFNDEEAKIYSTEGDIELRDSMPFPNIDEMNVRAEIPDWEKPGATKEIFGKYGEITDRLYKMGFRW